MHQSTIMATAITAAIALAFMLYHRLKYGETSWLDTLKGIVGMFFVLFFLGIWPISKVLLQDYYHEPQRQKTWEELYDDHLDEEREASYRGY